jgi:hypothetical protein
MSKREIKVEKVLRRPISQNERRENDREREKQRDRERERERQREREFERKRRFNERDYLREHKRIQDKEWEHQKDKEYRERRERERERYMYNDRSSTGAKIYQHGENKNLKHILCNEIQHGKCSQEAAGKKCWYAHSEEERKANLIKQVCRYLKPDGTCTRPNCRFDHDYKPAEPSSSTSTISVSPINQDSSSALIPKMCNYLQPDGTCKFGTGCKFYHSTEKLEARFKEMQMDMSQQINEQAWQQHLANMRQIEQQMMMSGPAFFAQNPTEEFVVHLGDDDDEEGMIDDEFEEPQAIIEMQDHIEGSGQEENIQNMTFNIQVRDQEHFRTVVDKLTSIAKQVCGQHVEVDFEMLNAP